MNNQSLTESLLDESTSDSFDLFYIVWAKLDGYPWWPAQITELPNSTNNFFKVTFIGEKK